MRRQPRAKRIAMGVFVAVSMAVAAHWLNNDPDRGSLAIAALGKIQSTATNFTIDRGK